MQLPHFASYSSSTTPLPYTIRHKNITKPPGQDQSLPWQVQQSVRAKMRTRMRSSKALPSVHGQCCDRLSFCCRILTPCVATTTMIPYPFLSAPRNEALSFIKMWSALALSFSGLPALHARGKARKRWYAYPQSNHPSLRCTLIGFTSAKSSTTRVTRHARY